MSRALNLSGLRFSRLHVVSKDQSRPLRDGRSRSTWLCVCDCGKTVIVTTSGLRSGQTKSCGCLRGKNLFRHGLTGHYLQHLHQNMLRRCKTERRYSHVKVCDQWRSLESFRASVLSEIGERPTANHSLDRKDNLKGYEPGNIRWATRKEQANNMRTNHRVTFAGHNLTLREWERKLGKAQSTFHQRARKTGCTIAQAVEHFAIRAGFFPLAALQAEPQQDESGAIGDDASLAAAGISRDENHVAETTVG
jgi:hypothetical protein